MIIVTPAGNFSRFQALSPESGYQEGSYKALNGIYSTLQFEDDQYIQTMPDNSQAIFNELGQLTELVDPQGHTLELLYNGNGTLSVISDTAALNRGLFLTYDVTGTHILTVTDGLGRSIGYTYSGDDLVASTDEMGRTTSYEYQNHLLTKVTNPLNQILEHTEYDVYTPAGKAISQTIQTGQRGEFVYGTTATTVTTIVPGMAPQVEVIGYDVGGFTTTIERNGTVVRSLDFDGTFAPGMRVDGNGHATQQVTSDAGYPLTITNALDQDLSFVYDQLNRPITVTDELGRKSRYRYDSQNHVITETVGIVPGFSAGFTTSHLYADVYGAGSDVHYRVQTTNPAGVKTRYGYNPAVEGQIITTTLGFGTTAAQTMTMGYDQAGHVLTTTYGIGTTDPVSDVRRYYLDGALSETIQNYRGDGTFDSAAPDQNSITRYERDELGRTITTTLAYGSPQARAEVVRYNPQGQISAHIENYQDGVFSLAYPDQDVQTLYAYDGLGRTILVTETGILTGTFDTESRQFSAHTTRVTRTEYDDLSHPVTRTLNYQPGQPIYSANPPTGLPDVNVQLITQYDVEGNVIGERDALGRWISYERDELNRVVTTTLNYENGNPLTIEVENEDWATFNETDIRSVNVYDPDTGLLERQIENHVNGVFTVTEPITDRITLFESDLLGRIVTTTVNYAPGVSGDALNRTQVTRYDSANRVVGSQDALGIWSHTRYDTRGRADMSVANCRKMVSMVDTPTPTGCEAYTGLQPDRNIPSTTRFDAHGRAHERVDALGTVSHASFDGLGRPIASIENYVAPGTPTTAVTNVTTLYAYNALGQTVAITDPVGAVVRFAHDGLGNVMTTTQVLSESEERISVSGYDRGGQRWSMTPDGRFGVMLIDGLGRIITMIQNYEDGIVAGDPVDQDLISQNVYDGQGRIVQEIDADGRRTSFTYDMRDQLIQVVENDQPSCAGVTTDDCDVTTQYRYDRVGNRIAIVDARTNTRTFSYDAASQLVEARDALNHVTSWSYNKLGLKTLQDDPRGSGYDLSYSYDNVYRTKVISATSLSAAVEYSYNGLGQRTSLSDMTGTTSFAYDPLRRITAVEVPDTGTVGYGYNARGDRTQLIYPDSTALSYSYFADGQLRAVTQTATLLASYSYDSAGRLAEVNRRNTTSTNYSYDGADRLRAIETSSYDMLLSRQEYQLDRQGLRTVITDTQPLLSDEDVLGTSTTLSTGTSSPHDPVIGQLQSGNYMAAYVDNKDGQERVFVQVIDVTGALGVAGAFSSNAGIAPAIASDPVLNRVFVVWQEPGLTQDNLYGRTYGYSFGSSTIFTITTTSDDETTPQVVYNVDDDEMFVVWQNETDGSVEGRRFSTSGSALGSVVTIFAASSDVTNVALAYDDDLEQYLVIGIDDGDVVGQLVSAATSLVGSPITIASTAVDPAHLQVAYTPDATDYLVTWDDARTGGDGPGIYGQLLSGSGSLSGSNYQLIDADGSPIEAGQLVYRTATDQFVLSWTRSSLDQVEAMLLDTGGQPDDDPWLISASADQASHVRLVASTFVWQQAMGSQAMLEAAVLNGSGSVTAGPLVLALPSSMAVYADLAYNSQQDEYLSVWWDDRGILNPVLRARRMRGDGTLLGPVFTITDSDSDRIPEPPRVDYSPASDSYIVVWQGKQGDNTHEIVGVRISALGAQLDSTPFLISDAGDYSYTPQLAYNSADDEYLVVWERRLSNGSYNGVEAQRVDSDGDLLGSQLTLVATAVSGPNVAYNNVRNEYLLIVMVPHIWGKRLEADGDGIGSFQEFVPLPARPCCNVSPIASIPGSDEYLIVWADYNRNSSGIFATYGQRVEGDGDLLGSEILINQAASGHFQTTQVVAGSVADESYMVGWNDNNRIQLQRMALDGSLLGDMLQVPQITYPDGAPAVAPRGDGPEFYVTWSHYLDGLSREIRGARFGQEVEDYEERVTTYVYDDLSRLVEAVEAPGETYSYTYDLAGNRLQAWESGALIHSLSYNAADQVVGWTYDNAGNLLDDSSSTFTYDALGRLLTLASAGTTITNTYNGDGALVREKLDASNYTTYTQDLMSPLSQLLEQQVDGTTTTYLYGHERLASVTGGTRSWHHADALGSVRMTTNGIGMPVDALRYDPWGTPVSGTPSPFGFTGELQNADAGLVHLRARWYQPATGRFLSKDPFEGYQTAPYSQHPYQYAYANPSLYTDPSGEAIPIPGGCREPSTGHSIPCSEPDGEPDEDYMVPGCPYLFFEDDPIIEAGANCLIETQLTGWQWIIVDGKCHWVNISVNSPVPLFPPGNPYDNTPHEKPDPDDMADLGVNFRRLKKTGKDYERFKTFIEEAQSDHPGTTLSQWNDFDYILSHPERQDETIFVHLRAGKIDGAVSFYHEPGYGDSLHIKAIESVRTGEGIGTELLRESIRYSKQNNRGGRLSLATEPGSAAYYWYTKKNGFTPISGSITDLFLSESKANELLGR